MRTVKEVSELSGVSVRTLHHYDAIGLLKPTEVTDAGYRLYDDKTIEKLQTVLMFRELEFPLKDIKKILDSPAFDPSDALDMQIKMLEARREKINSLITLARETKEKGVITMKFDAFDSKKEEALKAEAREKWGSTAAYKEYESRGTKDSRNAAEKMMRIFAELGEMKSLSPSDSSVQAKIGELKQFITDNFYTCTDEILRGLGEMYVSDERFKENIDKHGGSGTAQFASDAIKEYCK